MSYSGTEISKRIPDVTERQLGYWCERGWVKPYRTGTGTRGPGNGRTFSEAEMRVLMIMARLVGAGFPPEPAARVARAAVEGSPVANTATAELAEGITVTITGL